MRARSRLTFPDCPLSAPAPVMKRSERRGHGGGPGKAALEEQQPNGAAPSPSAIEEMLGLRGDLQPSALAAAATQGGRRSTESEVYDDGTNTFFW